MVLLVGFASVKERGPPEARGVEGLDWKGVFGAVLPVELDGSN